MINPENELWLKFPIITEYLQRVSLNLGVFWIGPMSFETTY